MEKTAPTGSTVIRRPNGTRLSRFCFTLNNYTDDEVENVKHTQCKWLIFGRETGENGTPHLQGACVIGRQVAFSTIKTWPGFERAHIEKMNGTPEDSKNYCTKQDSNPYEKGTLPSPGKRNDIHNAVARVRAGEGLKQLCGDDDGAVAVVKFHKGLTVLRALTRPRRVDPPTVLWFYGTTGTGKTKTAVELAQQFAGDDWWISSGSLRWFDGYDGQRVVIFDDLRTKHCEFSFLLRLLDRYPCSVEIKGATVGWTPQYIIITAPDPPRIQWSLRTTEQLDQLERRVSHQLQFPNEISRVWELYPPDDAPDLMSEVRGGDGPEDGGGHDDMDGR